MLCTGENAGCYHILTLVNLLCDLQDLGVPEPYKVPHSRVLEAFSAVSSGGPQEHL